MIFSTLFSSNMIVNKTTAMYIIARIGRAEDIDEPYVS